MQHLHGLVIPHFIRLLQLESHHNSALLWDHDKCFHAVHFVSWSYTWQDRAQNGQSQMQEEHSKSLKLSPRHFEELVSYQGVGNKICSIHRCCNILTLYKFHRSIVWYFLLQCYSNHLVVCYLLNKCNLDHQQSRLCLGQSFDILKLSYL